MISIPVIIICQNDSELTTYKNKTFLPFTKSYLENYGIIKNAIVFVGDDDNEKYCEDLGFEKIYRCKEKILSDSTTFIALNEFFLNDMPGVEWCIVIKPYQVIRDTNILYKAIQSINDNYDIMSFTTHIYDTSPIKIDDKTNKPSSEVTLNKMNNAKPIIKIIDDSLFLAKVPFLNKCYKESKGDVVKYSQLLVKNGKMKLLESANQLSIHFTSIDQINNFMHFLSDVKYKFDII